MRLSHPDGERAGVRRAGVSLYVPPPTGVAEHGIVEHTAEIRIADDDRAVRPSERRPNDVRAAARLKAAVGDDGSAHWVVGEELKRRLGDVVIDGVPGQTQRRSAGVLVHEDPGVVRQVCDHGHAGTIGVGGVCDVVGDGAPVHEVRGDLVDELLAVHGIALVGVEGCDFGLVEPVYRALVLVILQKVNQTTHIK